MIDVVRDYMRKQVWYCGIFFVFFLFCATMVYAVEPVEKSVPDSLKSDKLEDILSRGTLVVAINPLNMYLQINNSSKRDPRSNCSYGQYTENQVSGFDVDVATTIAKEFGVDSCYVTPDEDEIEQGNWSDKWDIYPSYFIINERTDRYYFTQPVRAVSNYFYIRNNDTSITSPSDLSGKIIGTYPDSSQSRYLNNTLEMPGFVDENPVKNATIIGHGIESQAFYDLVSGKLDGVLLPELAGDTAIENGSPITALKPKAFTGYTGLSIEKEIGINKKSFVRNLTKIIQKMHEKGELSNISMKYFGKDITEEAKVFDISILNQFDENGTT